MKLETKKINSRSQIKNSARESGDKENMLPMRKRMNLFKKEDRGKEKDEKGLIILKDVREAMKAEEILKTAGYDVRVVAPPPQVRVGCDLSIEISLIDRLGAERSLNKYNIQPVDVISLSNTSLKPLDILKEIDFGDYLMVKAGHMKLTFNKRNGEIVNISGGGCPDIPYLALSMVGKNLEKATRPRGLGFTLCAYMLDKAYEKALETFKEES